MPDAIAPPVAVQPAEAVELVAVAISDGDVEAAQAQYERGAVLCPWVTPCARPSDSVPGWLIRLAELRLPVMVAVRAVLPAGGLALVLSDRAICGTGPDGCRVDLCGLGATVVRRQPGGGWLIAADAWRLAGPGGVPG